MTDAARKVLAGFVRLPPGDQGEAIEAMNRFLGGTPEERSKLRKEYEGAVMGPVGSACPCCGRTEARP
jgi:hypothetical protein